MNTQYKNLLNQFFHSEKVEKYDLENITRACEYFDNPQNAFQSVHIAGTNGKGSVSKMIFQMLKESGKKVGVYTSPHNIDIRERWETENGLISEGQFIEYVEKIIACPVQLSYFEKCVLVAFLYFRDQGCEYAVIEVGLGGRLDATNIITPILSIITSISYDHTEFLGDTLEEIAREKGGIIKPGIPVILYEDNHTLMSIAKECGSSVIFPEIGTIQTNLLGEHQIQNARIAYEAGIFLGITDSIIRHALLHVQHNGRLQYLRPNLLIDGAHNIGGMQQLKLYLESQSTKWDGIAYACNLKKGKNIEIVTRVFPEVGEWNIVDSVAEYVSDARSLRDDMRSLGKDANILTPSQIYQQASNHPSILYVVFGSLYMFAEFIGY